MQRGCGLVVIHFALMLPSEIGNETFLQWIGGFKDYENPPRPIGEPLRLQDWSKQASHPICRGVKPFAMPEDEKYKTPERLLSDEPGFTPILPFPGKPGDPVWAWAWQRKDGGRSRSRAAEEPHAEPQRPQGKREPSESRGMRKSSNAAFSIGWKSWLARNSERKAVGRRAPFC